MLFKIFHQRSKPLWVMSQRGFKMSFPLNRRGPNYYQLLEIKPDASEKDIKTQYFKLAKKYRPDLNPDEAARKKFEDVQKAYETLSDQSKRSEYDSQMGLGSAGESQFKRGMDRARARAAAYSEDEYDDLSQFQRRSRRGAKKKER